MKHPYIISEIGINHNGDINLAKELISKSAAAGCHAVKFQKRTIDEVYTQEELAKPRESPWGTTFREQKEGLEFGVRDWVDLFECSRDFGLDFIVSCWDVKSVDFVEEFCSVDYHKIASALLTNEPFLRRLLDTDKRVILSTGMSTDDEIDRAVSLLGDRVEYILACTSTYPTKPEEVNLKYIQTLKEKYPNTKIGFSNHYNGLDACVGAVALGAECIEFHITKDRSMYGSDQAASIENAGGLTEAIFKTAKMIGDGQKVVYDSEIPIKNKLRR